ncbi:MAG: hypothetical protein QXK06_04840 [Candidatus Diapherotrites archaeon]
MIEIKRKSVRMKFREGIYFEEALQKALEIVPKNIKFKKSKKGHFTFIEFFPEKGTDLEELAGWFSNNVIALSK